MPSSLSAKVLVRAKAELVVAGFRMLGYAKVSDWFGEQLSTKPAYKTTNDFVAIAEWSELADRMEECWNSMREGIVAKPEKYNQLCAFAATILDLDLPGIDKMKEQEVETFMWSTWAQDTLYEFEDVASSVEYLVKELDAKHKSFSLRQLGDLQEEMKREDVARKQELKRLRKRVTTLFSAAGILQD